MKKRVCAVALVLTVLAPTSANASLVTHQDRAYAMRDRAIAAYKVEMVNHGKTPYQPWINAASAATTWQYSLNFVGVTWPCGDETCTAGLARGVYGPAHFVSGT